MNLRLMGTEQEIEMFKTLLEEMKSLKVYSVSKTYKNRKEDLYRVYIDLDCNERETLK